MLGPFRLIGPGGEVLALSSKKGVALIAMLATSANGERTRAWLQEKLWGSRDETQASASLRRELSNLRKILNTKGNTKGGSLLSADSGRVRLRLDVIDLDVARLPGGGWSRGPDAWIDAEFLEGIDIRGEEGFEEWLKTIRSTLAFPTATQGSAAPAFKTGDVGATIPKTPDARADVVVHRVADRTNDGDAGPYAEELTDELIGLLARFHWLRVGFTAGATEAEADSWLAGYAVELALAGSAIDRRLDVKLWEVRERRLVWTGRFALSPDTQQHGEPLRVATAQICARIEREEQARANKGPEEPGDFAGLIWRGRWRVNRLTREDSAAARRLFDAATTLAPDSPEALIQRATALCWAKWARRAPRNEFTEIRDFARRAILIDPDDCRGYWLAGVAETWLRNPTAAIGLLTRSVDLNPCFEPAHAQLGGTLNMCDRPEEAVKALDHALTLSPYDTHVFFRYAEIGMSWCMLGEFKTAVGWIDRALLQRPAYWYAQVVKIHALVHDNDAVGARAAGRELVESQPTFDRRMIEWLPFFDRNWVDRLCGSLSRAGVISANGTS